jgi:radical SAM protein with 4Fe4S-binding SPASM domain
MLNQNDREFAIHLKKKTIDDPIIGQLSYEEYDSPESCKFDKNENVCDLPFNDIEVQSNGNVYACCPGWNPASIGNLLEDDLKSIWNSKKANTVRESMTDGSYRYCNAKTCPAMIAGGGPRIIPKSQFVDPKNKFPRNIAFSVDNTCNLICPSCRTKKIITLSTDAHTRALTILRTAFRSVFNEPHDQEIIFTFDGVGEIFFSPVYREIFETEEVFKTPENWPNFKTVLCTNGTMMTEKIQDKYNILFERALGIRLSIDAGNKTSYEKVRCGGDWDLLWENINYLYNKTLKNDTNKSWAWNVILQEDNYESILDLVKLAYQYPDNLPDIYIVNMLNWGTYSQEEFDKKAVWFINSPNYNRAKEILSLPEVINYPKMFRPILD